MPVLRKSTHFKTQSLETEVLSLVSKTTDGMFANDDTGRILIWNRMAEKILGYSAEEVLGKACYRVVSGKEFSGVPFCFKGCSVVAMAKANHVMKDFTVQTRT
ncbi:MAG: PAS domain-containing protein, partial [Nitrospiria bacterium]